MCFSHTENSKAKIPEVKKRTYEEDDVDVLCVNCMKMIHASLATEHSLHCTQVHSDVTLIDQCSLIQQADYKIRRLKDSILKLAKDASLLQHRQNNAYYLEMLSTYAEDILKINEFTKADILKCREVLFNLNSMSTQFNGSPCLMVYLERLTVTSKEKYAQLLNYFKEISNGNNTEKTREELTQMAKQKMETLRKSIDNVSERLSNSSFERRSQELSPRQVAAPKKTIDDIVSDGGYNE
jgi:valyl-tRNA synthetase